MSSRERVLAAIDHREVDRIPTDYWATGETTEALLKAVGAESHRELWRRLQIDKIVNVMPGYLGPVIREPGKLPRDYFGVEYRPVGYGSGQGVYDEIALSPLAQYDTIDEIEASYTWPTADMFDFSGVADLCAQWPDNAREGGYMAPFYIYTNVRGMERCLMDLAADKEIAFYIIGKISDFLYEFHRRLFEAADGGIDIAEVTDDFGTQSGLMISTAMFDEFFHEPYAKFISLVKSHGIRVFHHDDGAIMEVLPRLVDLGIEVLNPIQWRLPGMSLEELKSRFGDKLCFHGAVDNQYVLPFGTMEELEEEVRRCISLLASDGTGYILAPCHNIQPNTPPEQIVHLYEMAGKYGTL